MGISISNVIATRKVRENTPDGKTVLVQIGKPRKDSVAAWECAFYITNIGMPEIQFGYGEDALQALIHAIEGARVVLEKSGHRFTWEYGEEGDIGIPRYVPMIYGKHFTERLHKMIDSEITRFAKAAERRHVARHIKKKSKR